MNALEQLQALITEADWTGVNVEMDPSQADDGSWYLDVWRSIQRDPQGNGGRPAPRCVVEWHSASPTILTVHDPSPEAPYGGGRTRTFEDIAEALAFVREMLA